MPESTLLCSREAAAMWGAGQCAKLADWLEEYELTRPARGLRVIERALLLIEMDQGHDLDEDGIRDLDPLEGA